VNAGGGERSALVTKSEKSSNNVQCGEPRHKKADFIREIGLFAVGSVFMPKPRQ
jgi:hypothetical protein